MVEKTIMSVGAGGDKFKYLDLDTQLLEVEAGVAVNEPVTYAVRKTIEGAVVEMIRAGERKGIWHYKPEPAMYSDEEMPEMSKVEEPALYSDEEMPEPEVAMDGADGSATITDEEIAEVLEILIEANNETRETVKEKASQVNAETTSAPQPEQVDKPVKVKVEPPLSDGIVCESSTHHFGCTEVTNEETITSTDTTDTDR
jgi:hypothetical protein